MKLWDRLETVAVNEIQLELIVLTSVGWLCFARIAFDQAEVEQQQIMLNVTSILD